MSDDGKKKPQMMTKMLRPDSGRDQISALSTAMLHSGQGRDGPMPSRMIRHDSGRKEAPQPKVSLLSSLPVKAVDKHPGVNCDGCNKPVGDKVRFKCLDCADFDLCATCEGNNAIANHHFDGKHLFAKIRDSTALGGNEAVNAYKKH